MLLFLTLQYDDDLFFCDYCSPLVHPVGWSQLVGHNLNATAEYVSSSLKKITLNQYNANDSTPAMFPAVSQTQPNIPALGDFIYPSVLSMFYWLVIRYPMYHSSTGKSFKRK